MVLSVSDVHVYVSFLLSRQPIQTFVLDGKSIWVPLIIVSRAAQSLLSHTDPLKGFVSLHQLSEYYAFELCTVTDTLCSCLYS